MHIPIPLYLQPFAEKIEQIDDVISQFQLRSSAGNHHFEIWYAGDLLAIDGEELSFITGATAKIMAKDALTGEEILLFDRTEHGYDAMFCDEYTEEERANRSLQKYNMPAGEVLLAFCYNIDYDEEMDDYEVNQQGDVQLINGKTADWQTVKSNGYDAFAFYLKQADGTLLLFAEEELA